MFILKLNQQYENKMFLLLMIRFCDSKVIKIKVNFPVSVLHAMKSRRGYGDKNSNISPEGGGSIFPRNVGMYVTTQKTNINFVIQTLHGYVGTASILTSAETLWFIAISRLQNSREQFISLYNSPVLFISHSLASILLY
jgi:hypothetical protein